MRKDITWLKAEVEKQDIVMDKGYIYTSDLLYLIDKLDEPEVLSQEWIDKHKYRYDNIEVVGIKDLQNLIVPKQELPVIPKFVAEVIEEHKELGYDVYDSIDLIIETNGGGLPSMSDWVAGNIDKYARAWLDGFTMAEEPLYYALVKGHELLVRDDSPIVVKNTKNHWNDLGINDSNANLIKAKDVE